MSTVLKIRQDKKNGFAVPTVLSKSAEMKKVFTKNEPDVLELFELLDGKTTEEQVVMLTQLFIQKNRENEALKSQLRVTQSRLKNAEIKVEQKAKEHEETKNLAFTSPVAKIKNLNALHYEHPEVSLSNSSTVDKIVDENGKERVWIPSLLPSVKYEKLIAAIDMDRFKAVNDTYGHKTGDMLLEHVGNTLKNSIRADKDTAYHLHGDEFAIVFTNCTIQEAYAICDRATSSINKPFLLNGCLISVDFSFGVSTHIEAADADLYYHKEKKRA